MCQYFTSKTTIFSTIIRLFGQIWANLMFFFPAFQRNNRSYIVSTAHYIYFLFIVVIVGKKKFMEQLCIIAKHVLCTLIGIAWLCFLIKNKTKKKHKHYKCIAKCTMFTVLLYEQINGAAKPASVHIVACSIQHTCTVNRLRKKKTISEKIQRNNYK